MEHSTFWYSIMNETNGPFHATGFPLPVSDIADLTCLSKLHTDLSGAAAPDPLRSPTPPDFHGTGSWGQATPPHLWSTLRNTPDDDLARLTTLGDFYQLPVAFVGQLRDEATLRARYRTAADWFVANGNRWNVDFSRGLKMPVWMSEPQPAKSMCVGSLLTVGALMDIPLPPLDRSNRHEHRFAIAYYSAIRILIGLPVSTTDVINSPVAAAMAAALGRMELLMGVVCGSINYAMVPAAAAAFNQVAPLEMYVRNLPLIFGLRWSHFSSEEEATIRRIAAAHDSKDVLAYMDAVCPPDSA